MATDTESMHDNMTRLRMRMVQQKLANERDKLQRSESISSDNGYEDQMKLRNAVLKRQELLDRIRQEQLNEGRPKTYSPRRRYTPSPLPPPSRRSLPDISNTRHYHFGYNEGNGGQGGAQVKHVIEHQFRAAPPQAQQGYTQQAFTQLPPIQQAPMPQVPVIQPQAMIAQPQMIPYQTMQPTYQWPALTIADNNPKKDSMFNKSDFMDMMMLQNAQMHHMAMQQMMLHQLPGARPSSIPYAEAAAPVALMRPPPSVYHHHIGQPNYGMPPMDYYQPGWGW